MPRKVTKQSNVKRLAKSVSKNPANARIGGGRKNPLRPKLGGNARRALADERELSSLARLMGALREEKIEFMLVGMSAALLQGVPGSTLDVDYWVNLPARQYMRVMNACKGIGAKLLANTAIELQDGTLVNFIYAVTGLGSFKNELKYSNKISFQDCTVRVLGVERILRSKEAIRRPKDLIHIEAIRQTLAVLKQVKKK